METGFERKGSLNVFETHERFESDLREAVHSRDASGIEFQVLDADEVVAFDPALTAGHFVGGIFYPQEALCEPLQLVEAVGRAAVDAGAAIVFDAEVLNLRTKNGRLHSVQTTAGDFQPETTVLAAGAWTGRLARSAGILLPLIGGKGYHVDLDRGDGDPAAPIFIQEGHVVAAPLGKRVRLAGTLELSGFDETINQKRVDTIQRTAERGIRSLAGRRVQNVWRGLRPCTPDGLPVVGRAPEVSNVILATGHAMMGITMAPITGRHVAELVIDTKPNADLHPLRPERFRSLR
jgi:D-amino-acid dehydrogenase